VVQGALTYSDSGSGSGGSNPLPSGENSQPQETSSALFPARRGNAHCQQKNVWLFSWVDMPLDCRETERQ